jgi:integrase
MNAPRYGSSTCSGCRLSGSRIKGRDQPAHQNTVGHAWRQAKAKAGVDGFRLHDLRHFYASGLIAAGCDISTVQYALGHSSPTVTLRTYTHLWPKAEDRTRAAAQGLVDTVFDSADESVTNGSTATA